MKKKILIILPLLLLVIYFSSTANAMTTEHGTGVDKDGLHTYLLRFEDNSGALILSTQFVNDSGVDHTFVTVVAIYMDETMNFRLRIYDSDEDKFIDPQNEDGIGVKVRSCTVYPHLDKSGLLWTVYVTDMSGETIYAQLSLWYTYVEGVAPPDPKGEEDPNSISIEQHKKDIRNIVLSFVIVIPLVFVFTGLFIIQTKGSGVRALFRSKFKGGLK